MEDYEKIDGKRVLELVNKFNFGRFVGTEGEKKALELIKAELKKIEYNNIYEEKFQTSLHDWKLLKIIIIFLVISLISLPISFYYNPYSSIIILILNFILFINFLLVLLRKELKLYKNKKKNIISTNIYTDLDSIKIEKIKKKVIFVGNWDSKYSLIPKTLKIVIYFVIIIGNIVISIIYIFLVPHRILKHAKIYRYLPLNDYLLYSCYLIAFFGLIWVFDIIINHKPQSRDNSISMGIMIELARYFKKNPTNHINFIFLLTGSREIKARGAQEFIARHENEFNKKASIFINLNTINKLSSLGITIKYDFPPKPLPQKLISLITDIAKKKNILVKKLNKYFSIGDVLPITKRGFKVIMLNFPQFNKRKWKRESEARIIKIISDALVISVMY